jgi:WD40 repeat protein
LPPLRVQSCIRLRITCLILTSKSQALNIYFHANFQLQCQFSFRFVNNLILPRSADVRDKSKRKQDIPVTGLDTISRRPEALLVTTRDSRIRLYQGASKQVVKYKGHRNKVSRISATFSVDGTYVICGSDDGCTFCLFLAIFTLNMLWTLVLRHPRNKTYNMPCSPCISTTYIVVACMSSQPSL